MRAELSNPELSKAETAFAVLRRDILDARLAPGLALTISSLKERYDLGWTPLREALSRLETERLVTFSPNKGYRVAGVSAEELLDLQKARKAIETTLLRESIEVGGEDWEQRVVVAHYAFKQTKALHLNMEEADLCRWEARHEAFHKSLLSGGPSIWLARFADQINDQLHRHHRILVLAEALNGSEPREERRHAQMLARASSVEHHTMLMDAALARKTGRALDLLAEHIGFTLNVYKALRKDMGAVSKPRSKAVPQ